MITLQKWSDVKRGLKVTCLSILTFIGALVTYQVIPASCPVPHTVSSSGVWTLTACQTITVSGITMVVQPGYSQWDGLSIPSILTNGLQITRSDYPLASLWHDTSYSMMDNQFRGPISKAEADEGLRLLLIRTGCIPIKAQAVKDAVDAWGFTAIRSHTEESVARERSYVKVTRQ